MSKVVIVGGGAAGMMAAVSAAESGHTVMLLEKNEKLGKKVYITGKGRCNLTNNCDVEELLAAVCVNRKFLYSAFYGFTSQDTIDFFEQSGMRTKTERGNRVFPVSDHASDVIAALSGRLKKSGVKVMLHAEVRELLTEVLPGAEAACEAEEGREASHGKSSREKEEAPERKIIGVVLQDGKKIPADAVIVATGGISYRTTGSTGDGYRFAKSVGHTVTDCSPSLVPMETAEDWAARLQGLSLRNVEVTVSDRKKELYREFGEMMFTHYGVTGPLVLTASSVVQKKLAAHPLTMRINLKPALTGEQLDARILREFEAAKNKQFKNVIGALYPAKLIPIMIERSGIPEDKPVHDISREERRALVTLTRGFSLTLTGLRDYNEAIVTRGGVSTREVNPATMESKKVAGLYFAGEVLDLDAVTGGFNLQVAWSTGYAAGKNC